LEPATKEVLPLAFTGSFIMARIRLDIPPHLPFRTSTVVRITDLNYGAHLGNDRVLSLIHDARAQLLAEIGVMETDAFGVGMAMVDAAIQYKAEGFFQDKLEITVGTCDFTSRSWDFVYRIHLPDKGKVLALAKTGMVAFDYTARKVTDIPAPLLEALQRYSARD
jgi:acyl-CoA thioester hydrolase